VTAPSRVSLPSQTEPHARVLKSILFCLWLLQELGFRGSDPPCSVEPAL